MKSCAAASPPSPSAKHSILHHLVVKKRKPVLEDYEIDHQIGQGYLGRVYAVTPKSSTSKRYYALKEIDIELVDEESLDMMRNEIELLTRINHPNIVRAFCVYEEPNQNLSIIMEWCSGGDLNSRAPYTQHDAQLITVKLLESINYLHHNNIIHRDLKPENILFEDDSPEAQIKLIDFGLSCQFLKDTKVMGRVGTWYTMSPEQIQGEYDSKADMWAIGVIVYILLSGEKPFWTPRQAAEGDLKFDGPSWQDISSDAKDLIRNLLKVDPNQRFSAQQALNESAWVQNTKKQPSPLTASLVTRVHNNMWNFATANEFRKLAMQAIARKATLDEIAELRAVFDELDQEHDGTISLQDLKSALLSTYTSQEVEAIFRGVDVDDDGELDYTGFLAATLETKVRIEGQRIAEAFEMFDQDNKGYVTASDLKEILGSRADDDYIEQLIHSAGQNGKVTFDDFQRVFEQKESERFEQLSSLRLSSSRLSSLQLSSTISSDS